MLIPFDKLNITKKITGVIHIGAHECEERTEYQQHFNLDDDKILWFEALQHKVEKVKRNIPTIQIFHECISDSDNNTVDFNITNNFQSSSMLSLKTHLQEHPYVFEIFRMKLQTKRLDTFLQEHNINPSEYNFLNLDIQGAELLALKGCGDILKTIDYIYTEVNEKELYENCCLITDLDTYLKEFGFVRVLTEMTTHGWGDAFYVKE